MKNKAKLFISSKHTPKQVIFARIPTNYNLKVD